MVNRKELMERNKTFIIAIDPGVNTGYALYCQNLGKLLTVKSLMIHEALDLVKFVNDEYKNLKLVRVEDARLRKFVTGGREKLQGVGSVKRDCKIWEDFLSHNEIPFEMIAPKNLKTKVNAKTFKMITGWDKPTNEHSRDAGMNCFGYNK